MNSNGNSNKVNASHVLADAACVEKPMVERWFRRVPPSSAAVRLFCFPYAGGSARMFREWHDWCGPEVEVVAIELPGRGFHSRSPLIDNMSSMIERLLPALDPLLDKPFALFGHSMGALISFELSRTLRASGRKAPLHLFASGMRAPHLWTGYQIHTLPDRQFVEALRKLNGTPAEILDDSSLLEMFIPILRADLRLSETYRYTLAPRLQHPITVFSGLNDITSPPEQLQEWQRHTRGGCALRLLEGDHFFIQQHAHLVAASILKSLGRVSLPAAFDPTPIAENPPTTTTPEAEPVFSSAD